MILGLISARACRLQPYLRHMLKSWSKEANHKTLYDTGPPIVQGVNIVSGELNSAAAKKYDLEAWWGVT